jgi:hypothetical protein
MNRTPGKDSTITLLVPYSNGDAIKGFQYEGGDITEQQYSRMMVETYNKYKNGVWDTYIERAGMNMAINNYEKEIVHYAQQQYYFDETKVDIFNAGYGEITIDELIRYYQNRNPFILIIDMYKMSENPDLETDMKSWLRECVKIKNNPHFSDAEKIQYSSKKNLKIKFDDAKSQAILQNCKMMDYKNQHTFVFIVEKIIFVTN